MNVALKYVFHGRYYGNITGHPSLEGNNIAGPAGTYDAVTIIIHYGIA